MPRDNDNNNGYQNAKNDTLVFAIIFLIVRGFQTGFLTWPRVIIGVIIINIILSFVPLTPGSQELWHCTDPDQCLAAMNLEDGSVSK